MILEPMAESSEMVAEAVRKPENAGFKTGGATAGEWFARRIKNQRIKNRKVNFESTRLGTIFTTKDIQGPETWKASRGTEHRASAY